jgi:hypothetical protein
MSLPKALKRECKINSARGLTLPILSSFTLLCNAAETDFVLEEDERESIQSIIDSSLRTGGWNDEVTDQRSYVYSHSDGDYSVRVVEIEYAPFHETTNIKHQYQILCVMEKNVDIDWDCKKQLNRSIYSSRISKWIPLLDGDSDETELDEVEAINFINKVADNKVLSWEEKNVEIEFEDLFNIGLALSYDQKSIDLHASHEELGLLVIEIPRNINGGVTKISGIAEFFRLCDDSSMQYGVDACEEDL